MGNEAEPEAGAGAGAGAGAAVPMQTRDVPRDKGMGDRLKRLQVLFGVPFGDDIVKIFDALQKACPANPLGACMRLCADSRVRVRGKARHSPHDLTGLCGVPLLCVA